MTMQSEQLEQWARKLADKGMSGAEARETARVLRSNMSDLDDMRFTQWLGQQSLSDILRVVGRQAQTAGLSNEQDG